MLTIAVISAMEVEIENLQKKLGNYDVQVISNHRYIIQQLNNVRIVTVDSGIGKVNAAITTQSLIDHFKPTYIVNTGIAGGLDRQLNHHDVIIGKELTYHDLDHNIMKNYFPRTALFRSSDTLVSLIEKILRKHHYPYKIGKIITGDQFINTTQKSEELYREYAALCVEMEGAAIAHCAYANDIEFVVIRSLSDFADDQADEDYSFNEETASYKASDIIYEMIQELSN